MLKIKKYKKLEYNLINDNESDIIYLEIQDENGHPLGEIKKNILGDIEVILYKQNNHIAVRLKELECLISLAKEKINST